MDKSVYEKFAGALQRVHAVKVAESRRAEVLAKVAEAIGVRRMEKSAQLEGVARTASKVLRGLRGVAGRFGEPATGAVAEGHTPLKPLVNSAGRAIRRLGITAQDALSPKVNLNMSSWNPLKLLTSVRVSDPLRKVPEKFQDTKAVMSKAEPGGSSIAAKTDAAPKYEGTLQRTRRVSPTKVLAAMGIGGAGTAYAMSGRDGSVAQPKIKQQSIDSVLGGLGDEASALWRVVQANPRMAALVAAALAAGGYGIHALMSDK